MEKKVTYNIYDQSSEKKRLMRKAFLRAFIYIITAVAVAALGWFFIYYAAVKTVVIDDSMSPVLSSENVVFVNTLAYAGNEPDRMDVISFRIGSSGNSPVYIRRVAGIPGDTVKITGGKLYVNDTPVELYEDGDPIETAGAAAGGITLGEGEYFVFCDNYNESSGDSRLDSFGTVMESRIIGKVWYICSPRGSIGRVK
ncbi:MAG: signal peptidase I [Lachnospiraceae bacterium]|nr:signal peptidase I [Lachnospiraceae bacterium]